MGLLFDSFWRAVAYCVHPRVIALSFLPLLIMAALAATFFSRVDLGIRTGLSLVVGGFGA